jgi:RimJ/RimL family protein N-acetyltransferase
VEPVEITADGLLLRPWRTDDIDDVERACQDPQIQQWTSVPVPYRREHAEVYVETTAPAGWADGTAALFAVTDAATGALLGSCGLVAIHPAGRTAEIGFWTAPWARGRGVATRAARAVAGWAFEALDLRRIVWQAGIGNQASRLVALGAGFRVDGRIRRADRHLEGWIGTRLPGDDDRPEVPLYVRRRAAVFGRPQPTLFATTRSGEIRLRPLEERDIDGVVAGARDPESVRWTTVPHPYERGHAEYFVGAYGPTVWARGTGAVFGIGEPESDTYAGIMELRLWEHDPAVADVGFVVPPQARGRGYAAAALTAVAAWGFTALDLTRIEWRANAGNIASRRVAEKAGFTFEGTARGALDHRGERVDAWVAALLAADIAGPRRLASATTGKGET